MTGATEHASGKLAVDRPADAVARIRIANPPKRGALDHEILDGLAKLLPSLDKGIETRCLIVTGTDNVFSSGYDIGDIPDEVFAEEAERLVAHPFSRAIEAIEDFSFPTLAAINGHALGGGLELALSCDLRVAAATAKLGMPPAKLGLIYSHTGLQKFIDAVGPARTRELFLVGRNLSAERAEQVGLVNEVHPAERLADAAVAQGQQTHHPPAHVVCATDRDRGAGADRAAALLVPKRRLPRGCSGVRREAQAAVAGPLTAERPAHPAPAR
jgi:enoyl-CoA hydratase/carnithine racemase